LIIGLRMGIKNKDDSLILLILVTMTEREYLVALYSFLPFGPARGKLLISYFGSSKKVWNASEKKLREVGLRDKIVKDFGKHREEFDFVSYFNRLNKLSVEYVTINDSNYPFNLTDLDDAPLVLYIKGKLKSSDVNAVAIVGSRKMTSYGREVTERFALELANFGVTIVSGLAFGIDVVAHKASLAAGGRCIAVLASGLDQITPCTNEWLGIKIIKSGGALVSEYPLGTVPHRSFFPFRNRIISGLSKAVLIVEGMRKSGTLHTASHAAKQGREVFAIPGQITSPMSGAPHFLIKRGAKMTTSVEDVMDELDMQLKVDKDMVEKVLPTDENELRLLEILASEALHLDEIARASTLKVGDVSARLTVMELKGLVKNIGNGVYKKC
jgi:DNA processing protein